MNCKNCGEKLLDDSKFCEYCGKIIANTEADKAKIAGTPFMKESQKVISLVLIGCVTLFIIASLLLSGLIWYKNLVKKKTIAGLRNSAYPTVKTPVTQTPSVLITPSEPTTPEPKPSGDPLTFGVAIVNSPNGFADIFEGPGNKYKILTRIYEKERFLIISKSGDWWHVLALTISPGIRGYVHRKHIKLLRGDAVGTGILNDSEESAEIYAGPSPKCDVITIIKKEEMFIILEFAQWTKILSWDGKIGYIESKKINNIFPQKI